MNCPSCGEKNVQCQYMAHLIKNSKSPLWNLFTNEQKYNLKNGILYHLCLDYGKPFGILHNVPIGLDTNFK